MKPEDKVTEPHSTSVSGGAPSITPGALARVATRVRNGKSAVERQALEDRAPLDDILARVRKDTDLVKPEPKAEPTPPAEAKQLELSPDEAEFVRQATTAWNAPTDDAVQAWQWLQQQFQPLEQQLAQLRAYFGTDEYRNLEKYQAQVAQARLAQADQYANAIQQQMNDLNAKWQWVRSQEAQRGTARWQELLSKIPAWRDEQCCTSEMSEFIPWLRSQGVTPDQAAGPEELAKHYTNWRGKGGVRLDSSKVKPIGGKRHRSHGSKVELARKAIEAGQRKAQARA